MQKILISLLSFLFITCFQAITCSNPIDKKKQIAAAALDAAVPVSDLQKIILGYLDNWEPTEKTCEAVEADYPHTIYSRSGDWVASTASRLNSEVKITNLLTGALTKLVPTSDSETQYPGSAACSPCGNFLAIGYSDGIIKIWDSKALTCAHEFVGHAKSYIGKILYSHDGKWLFSGTSSSDEHTIKIWDTANWTCKKQIQPGDIVTSLAISPCGLYIAAGLKGTVKLFSSQTGEELITVVEDSDMATYVAYSPSGKELAIGQYAGGALWLYDMTTKKRQKKIYIDSYTRSLVYSPCGNYIAIGLNAGMKIASRTALDQLAYGFYLDCDDHIKNARSVAFSPCGSYMAVGISKGPIQIWRNQKNEIEHASKAVAKLK